MEQEVVLREIERYLAEKDRPSNECSDVTFGLLVGTEAYIHKNV